ncbi:MAG: acyl carrier protein [Planctomycetaceae bacterium]|nr:acyl carrier protein [Planctomycetaceae bacterium]
MPDSEQLRNELAEWISEILLVQVDPARDDAAFVADYGADSMDIVDIVEKVEKKYAVTIRNDEVGSVRTFGDLSKMIFRKKGERHS